MMDDGAKTAEGGKLLSRLSFAIVCLFVIGAMGLALFRQDGVFVDSKLADSMRAGARSANASARLSPLDQQLQSLAEALRQKPHDIDLRISMADLLIEKAEFASARALISAIEKEVQTDVQRFAVGRLHLRAGNNMAAAALFGGVDPQNTLAPAALIHQAEALVRSGRFGEAEKIIVAVSATIERDYILTRIKIAQGYFDQAQFLVDGLLARKGDDPRFWLLRAHLNLGENDLKAASIAAGEVRRHDHYTLQADLIDIEIALRDGRAVDAGLVLDQLAARLPHDHRVRSMVVLLAINQGLLSNATQLMETMDNPDRFDQVQMQRLAGVKIAQGDHVQATALLKELRVASPENWLVDFLGTENALHTGQAILDESYFEALSKHAPNPIVGMTQMARLKMRQGKIDDVRALVFAIADLKTVSQDTLDQGKGEWPFDRIFGRYANIAEGEREERSIILAMARAILLVDANEPEKARALLTGLESDPMYQSVIDLLMAEIELGMFGDNKARALLSKYDDDQETNEHLQYTSAWQARLNYRLALRAGQPEQAMSILNSAINAGNGAMIDILVQHYLVRDDVAAVQQLMRTPVKFQSPTVFADFASVCLADKKGCATDNSVMTELIDQGLSFGPQLPAQTALVALYDRAGKSAQAWAVQRDIVRQHGQTSEGQAAFVATVASRQNWKQSDILLAAIRQSTAGDQRQRVAMTVLAERLRAKRNRRAMRLASISRKYASDPLVIETLAEVMSPRTPRYNTLVRTALEKSLGDGAGDQEGESQADDAMMNLVNRLMLIKALATIDGKKSTISRLRQIRANPYSRDESDGAIALLATLTHDQEQKDLHSTRISFSWPYLRHSLRGNWHQAARPYATELKARGYGMLANRLLREAGDTIKRPITLGDPVREASRMLVNVQDEDSWLETRGPAK